MDYLALGNVVPLVDAEIFKEIVSVGFQPIDCFCQELVSNRHVFNTIDLPVVVLSFSEVGFESSALRDDTCLETEGTRIQDTRVDTETPVDGAGHSALQVKCCCV